MVTLWQTRIFTHKNSLLLIDLNVFLLIIPLDTVSIGPDIIVHTNMVGAERFFRLGRAIPREIAAEQEDG